MTSTLNVEATALQRHASGRYSDGLVCDAIKHYVMHVGAVPAAAWGTLSFTQKWKTEWGEAVADRAKEAGHASERFTDVGQTLYQVAADYSNSDVAVATNFSAIEQSPIMPFVTALEQAPAATARPGGNLSTYTGHPGGGYTVAIPEDTPEGHDLNNLFKDGRINQAEMWPEGTDTSQTPMAKLRAEMSTEGRKKLFEFMSESYETLNNAEAIVRQWGLSPARSSLEVIDEAYTAWPGIIANRANLLKLGANAYRDLKENLTGQVKDLKQYWTSPGASGAYCIYAEQLGNYFTSIADNLKWLGEEGEKAAKTIDDLQLAYANLGYKHLRIIAAQLKAYTDAATSVSKSIEKPLDALSNALNALVTTLIASMDAAAAKAESANTVSQKAIDNAPHFANNNYDIRQPPQSPSNDWRGNNWKP